MYSLDTLSGVLRMAVMQMVILDAQPGRGERPDNTRVSASTVVSDRQDVPSWTTTLKNMDRVLGRGSAATLQATITRLSEAENRMKRRNNMVPWTRT